MEKILSIIVPTYNMEKYLRKCLDSLIVSDENMQRLEVLVINDGSKDNSSQIAHEYENKYPQTFKVIDKENGNYGSCINRGLKEATGKYVKILDADDSFDNLNFNTYIDFLDNTITDLVITDFDIVNQDELVTKSISFNFLPSYIFKFPDLANTIQESIQMHGITYKLSIIKKMKYVQSEGISYTDQEWIFCPMNYVQTAVYYPHVIYKYLIGREGQTMEVSTHLRCIKHTMQGVLKMVKDYELFYDETNIKSYLNYIILTRCGFIYKNYLIFDNNLDESDIEYFDKQLMEFPRIYVLTNEIEIKRGIPIYFVKYWRSHSYSLNNFFYRSIKYLVNHLRK